MFYILADYALAITFSVHFESVTQSFVNPLTDEHLNLLGTVKKQVCHFSSLFIFCLGCKTISRRAASRLIVLHPKKIKK
jgi:hypothetical protein